MTETIKTEEHRRFLLAFGRLLRKRRRDVGWTQEELAERSGLHRTFIGSLERGDRGANLDRLVDIARAFAVEPATLIPNWADVAAESSVASATELTRDLAPSGTAVTEEELVEADAEWRILLHEQYFNSGSSSRS